MARQKKTIEHPNAKTAKWIIPPHLAVSVNSFLSTYDYFSKQPQKPPLMIMGDTGVGKSLFTHLYEMRFREDFPKKIIKKLNIAALPHDLIQSELFGHLKGAFTGAIRDRKGIIQDADLLILEEIGELPEFVQAKLLTFIEDGIYYQVGSDTPGKPKKLQIISTTNKEKSDFRPDFYERFYKFEVPALHERRTDLLYYVAHIFPMLIDELRPWEVLSLLTYNWPGNVRELENLCREIEITNLSYASESNHPAKNRPALLNVGKVHSHISWEKVKELQDSFRNFGIDIDLLEKLLNEYGLGFDVQSCQKAFRNFQNTFTTTAKELEFDKRFSTISYGMNDYFSKIELGFDLYCCLFEQPWYKNKNLLDIKNDDLMFPIFSPVNFIEKPLATHHKLILSIIEFLYDTKLPKDKKAIQIPDSDYGEFLVKLFDMKPKLQGNDQKKKDIDPSSVSYKEWERFYFTELVKTGGTLKDMATRAGLSASAVHGRIKNIRNSE